MQDDTHIHSEHNMFKPSYTEREREKHIYVQTHYRVNTGSSFDFISFSLVQISAQ